MTAIKKLSWKVYKSLKAQATGPLLESFKAELEAQMKHTVSLEMAIPAAILNSLQSLEKTLSGMQTEFIQGCSNFTEEQLDAMSLGEIRELHREVLSMNPLEEIIEMEKNSPVGVVATLLYESLKPKTPAKSPEETLDTSGAFDPAGG